MVFGEASLLTRKVYDLWLLAVRLLLMPDNLADEAGVSGPQ